MTFDKQDDEFKTSDRNNTDLKHAKTPGEPKTNKTNTAVSKSSSKHKVKQTTHCRTDLLQTRRLVDTLSKKCKKQLGEQKNERTKTAVFKNMLSTR